MRLFFIIILMSVSTWGWQFMGFGNDTQEKKVEIRKVLPMDVDYEKMSAGSHLNSIRSAMGMNTLLENDQLALAAQGHADYLVANKAASHYQSEGGLGFIGVKPLDRTLWANYASTHVSENLSTQTYSAQSSIDGLFSAIYHRFGFLSPSIDEVGVGVTQNKTNSEETAFVYVMGNSAMARLCHEKSFNGSGKYYYKICKNPEHHIGEKAFDRAVNLNKRANPKIVLYPYDGQDEVPPAFYEEMPDPLPDYSVSGFPVSIEFNDYFFKEVKLHSFTLYDSKNNVIDVRFMHKDNDPHSRFTDKQYALFPLQRLDYASEYRAEVVYSVKGKEEQITWLFQTKKPTEVLHVITKNEETIHLDAKQSHIIYFKPQNGQDILTNIQFPTDIYIEFLDNNTLKLGFMGKSLDDFTIKSKERTVHVEVK